MGGNAATTYVAIHDDMGVVYMERVGGNNTTNWCSFSDKWPPRAGQSGFYPYLGVVWLTVTASRETFEARMQRAARK